MKKGLISGIKRMEIHDGDGLRTTVFFKGCPLKCNWCHNPESISFQKQVAFFKEKCIHCSNCHNSKTPESANICPTDALHLYGVEYTVEELTEILIKDRPFFGKTGGVTFSGGECLAQQEFVVELAERLFKENISVDIDTSGFVPREVFMKILPFTDCFLFDIKAIDPQIHKKFTGQSNELILDNLEFLVREHAKIEIRYPLIKGCNDHECDRIASYLKRLEGIQKVKVLQYHSFAASRYEALGLPNTLPKTETTLEDMERAVSCLKTYGFHAVNGALE